MSEKVVMPQLGESIAEGTIVKWLKQPGDAVKKDEDLLVISTDKVEAEIPAPATGVLLSIDVPEGETVDVGTVLGHVGEDGEQPSGGDGQEAKKADDSGEKDEGKSAQKDEQKDAQKDEQKDEAKSSSGGDADDEKKTRSDRGERSGGGRGPAGSTSSARFVSPLVRRIAADNGVSNDELDSIEGTGNNGRVTKKDLLAYLDSRGEGGQQQQQQQQQSQAPAQTRGGPQVSIPAGERELVQPASTMRKAIMTNMVNSKQTSAHVTTFFEIDFTAVDKVRGEHKARFKQEEGVSLTYTTFLAAATAQVLKRHPYINAEIRGTDVVFKKDVHLGMAVAIEQPEPGLMVPVIKNADQMNLRGLAHAITDLANRVRTKKIKPDELSGGTFTITNPGNYGAIIGTPIINQPQVAILGVGKIDKQPVVMDVDGTDVIAIRKRGVLSLSFDHRLIDGATADIFMADLKTTLETWTEAP